MKTSICLCFFDTNRNTPMAEALNGPFLFDDLSEAQDKILTHIVNQIDEKYLVPFLDFAKSLNVTITEETNGKICQSTVIENPTALNLSTVINWYHSVANNDENYFAYEIKRMPSISFIEQLDKASSVCIDGNFIYSITKVDLSELESVDDVILDCSFTSDDGDLYEYAITLEEANRAQYDPGLNAWVIDELAINFYLSTPL